MITAPASNKDKSYMALAMSALDDHDSGGSYNMTALWCNSKPQAFGYNKLETLASHIDSRYPPICGMHAELDLIKKYNPSGGKIYIAGRVSKSNNMMSNTQPCNFCVDAMVDCGITKVVYILDGAIVNSRIG